MDYSQTLAYLYSRLPMFHRIGAAAYKGDLTNINSLSDILDHPEKKIKTIHIAGTNGKGSVSHMLASVLQEAGYKTGLFTSPHLKDFRERIRINGKMVEEKTVIRFVEENLKSFENLEPSFFEWTTAFAFDYFAKESVDIAIIETGLGGRLDSTNIITPELSIITNISFDHMQFLGDTLVKIAGEKAGIIKEGVPVITGERQEDCEFVFIEKALENNSPLLFASDHYVSEFISADDQVQTFRILKNKKILFDELVCGLRGDYQAKNICTVLLSLEILKKKFPGINETSIRNGLKNVVKNTGLQGRCQILNQQPLTIADVGHNEAGIRYVTQQLSRLNYEKLHIVFGMVNDKSPEMVLSLLPNQATYYFCKANLPRAMEASVLKAHADAFGLKGNVYTSVAEAYEDAKLKSGEKDVIFVGGSTFVVAEVI
jgi:dihydrofolate synthase/folylpolyglutamate synthase